MSLEIKSFEFDGFLLEAKEKVFLRNSKPLAITPKAFQLLQVENYDHLVERNELLNTVWADSFVEEVKLPLTISVLRKVLGDDKPRLTSFDCRLSSFGRNVKIQLTGY